MNYLLEEENSTFLLFTQSYFAVKKKMKLNSTHCVIMKIPCKWELQQTAFNISPDNWN